MEAYWVYMVWHVLNFNDYHIWPTFSSMINLIVLPAWFWRFIWMEKIFLKKISSRNLIFPDLSLVIFFGQTECLFENLQWTWIWLQVAGGDFPHLMVFGPSGAGKKTRVMCLLRELYGSGVEKLKIDTHTFTTPSKKKIDISAVSSNYHIEVNPRWEVFVQAWTIQVSADDHGFPKGSTLFPSTKMLAAVLKAKYF